MAFRTRSRGAGQTVLFHPRGQNAARGEHTSAVRPRRRQNASIHGWGGISAEGSLPLSGITPSKRLNIQFSKNKQQAVGPWGHSWSSSKAKQALSFEQLYL